MYQVSDLYNSFYSDNYIIKEESKEIQSSWLTMSELVLKTNLFI